MSDTTVSRFSRITLLAAALLAITAIGIKLWRSHASETLPIPATTASPQAVNTMIASLEAKLKSDPNDSERWRMLGLSFFQTQRFAEAAMAYKRATALKPDNGDYWSLLGEALVTAGPGDVPPDAKAAFDKAVALNRKDPRARYFLGVSKDMAGNHKGAIDDWFALLKDTPAGAPWQADVRRTIEAVGKKDNIDVAGRFAALSSLAPAPGAAGAAIPGPNTEQMRAAASLPPSQQEAMIAGMVDGLSAKLKANPKNVEGWIMLMRSYTTLGRRNDASAAYRSAVAVNPAAKAELDEAAKTLDTK